MTTAEPKIAKAASREARASFRWDDPLRFDDQLTEDERLIRDTARAYAQDKLLPRVIEDYMEEQNERAIFFWASPSRKPMGARRPATFPTGWWRARSSGWIPVSAP